MVTTMALPEPIEAPAPTPLQSGLIPAMARVDRVEEDTTHERWEIGGTTYTPVAAGLGGYAKSALDYDNTGTDVYEGGIDPDNHNIITSYPFLLVAEETESAFGWEEINYVERATQRMEAMQSKIAEREFWTGEVAQLDDLDPDVYQWLGQESAIDLTPGSGAVPPRIAMSLLEAALGQAGNGQGVLHFTRGMGMLMPDRWSEALLYSQLDSVVILGAGYPGTGPDGSDPADGEEWVYATNLVNVRLGPVEVFPDNMSEALDRQKNTVSYRVERYCTVSWDGNAHYAIRASNTATTSE